MKKTFPMTAPLLTSENPGQEQNQETLENNNPPVDTSTPVVQNPPVQPTKTLDSLYQEAYNEQYRKNVELEARLAARDSQQAPARQVDDTNFFNEPATNVRALISEELSKALGTLPQEIRAQSRMSAYTNLKNQFRAHSDYPDFAEHEANIDAIVNAGNVQPDIQGINNAILYLRGMKYTQSLKNPAPTNIQTPPTTPVNPPYVPPSAPAAPRNGNNPPAQVTEIERRIASQRGMTIEQFIAERDNPNPSLLSDPNPKPAA